MTNPLNRRPASRGGAFCSTEERLIREEEIARVRAALRTLSPEQYQVVILQYYYNLKLDEIARSLISAPAP